MERFDVFFGLRHAFAEGGRVLWEIEWRCHLMEMAFIKMARVLMRAHESTFLKASFFEHRLKFSLR